MEEEVEEEEEGCEREARGTPRGDKHRGTEDEEVVRRCAKNPSSDVATGNFQEGGACNSLGRHRGKAVCVMCVWCGG